MIWLQPDQRSAAIGIVPALTALRVNTVHGVKFVHHVESAAEATERHDHIHEVREVSFNKALRFVGPYSGSSSCPRDAPYAEFAAPTGVCACLR